MRVFLRFIPALVLASCISVIPAFSQANNADSLGPKNLKEWFSKGSFNGNIRSFYMRTDNAKPLTDFDALALGGNLGYQTAKWRGFSMGLGTYHSARIFSTNLTKIDTLAKRGVRYEAGLFDWTDLSKKEVNVLGEAWVEWSKKSNSIKAGRMKISTPLINPQDGRMIPTLVEGVWLKNGRDFTNISDIDFELGYLASILPRGSGQWKLMRNSLGIYPIGKNISGASSAYKGNISTDGIIIGSLRYNKYRENTQTLYLSFWNYYVTNIFNTAYSEFYKDFLIKNYMIVTGVQFIRQDQVGSGGNDDVNKSYFQQKSSEVAGLRLKFIKKLDRFEQSWSLAFNYNYFSGSGMFLFPREWGIEPLYTFQKRERMEGTGKANAYMIQFEKQLYYSPQVSTSRNMQPVIKTFTGKLSFGYYQKPAPTDYHFNKYEHPSYYQANLELIAFGRKKLHGLAIELLIAHKLLADKKYDQPAYMFNKVNMTSYNLILNYSFGGSLR
jgi:hypothetical protein